MSGTKKSLLAQKSVVQEAVSLAEAFSFPKESYAMLQASRRMGRVGTRAVRTSLLLGPSPFMGPGDIYFKTICMEKRRLSRPAGHTFGTLCIGWIA